MNQSRRMVPTLLVALTLSGACTYLLRKNLLHASEPKQAATRKYFSPTRPIPPGEIVRPADLQTISWPANDPVTGAPTRAEEIVGRVSLYPLAPGQPILDRQLAAAGSGSGLASKIPNGMRAIALKSDEVVGVAGFLTPGSHVDVLATYRTASSVEPITATVLQNAEVIAAGQQIEPDPSGKAVSATVVTLLLEPQQAERALLASSQGSLHFVLRNNSDLSQAPQVPVTLSQLVAEPNGNPVSQAHGATATSIKPRQTPRPVEHPAAPVEIILGGQKTSAVSATPFPGAKQ